MATRILITGGAGFIGSHVADELLAHGYRVRALDGLTPQVHGGRERPEYLSSEVELLVGGVRDPDAVTRAVDGVDAVVPLAARVGVGQSMYELAEYTAVNSLGTAVLLEALLHRPVGRLLVASSMSVYGEGLYRAPDGSLVDGVERPREQLERGEWELGDLQPVPTPETKRLALESDRADGEVLNVGSGESVSVLEIAERLARILGVEVEPELLGRWRAGDIRHCFADITRARELLGYEPQVGLEDGMRDLAGWLAGQVAVDRVDAATQELSSRGLL